MILCFNLDKNYLFGNIHEYFMAEEYVNSTSGFKYNIQWTENMKNQTELRIKKKLILPY